MVLDDLLNHSKPGERKHLEGTVKEFIGEHSIADIDRPIYRSDGSQCTDFDIVTKDGTVIEVFGTHKGPKRYNAQLRRISQAIQDEMAKGEPYSGNFYVFYCSKKRTPYHLNDCVDHLKEEFPSLRINVVNPNDL